jgi:hypothetical protein
MERSDLSDALRLPLIDNARRTGAVTVLPYLLTTGAERSWWTGTWEDATKQLDEAIELGALVGQDSLPGFTAGLQAQYAAAYGDRNQLAGALERADHCVESFGIAP